MAKYRKMDLSKLYEFKRRRGYLKSDDGRYLDIDKNGHYYLSEFGRKFRGKRIKPIRCRKEDACYFHIDAGDSIHLVAFGIIYVTKDGQHWVAVSGNGDGDGDGDFEDEDEDDDDDDDDEEEEEDDEDEDEEEQSDKFASLKDKKVMITPPLVATIPKTKPAGHEITENHEIRDQWRAQITKETVRAMFAYMDKNPSFFEEWRDDKYMLENTGGEKITLIDEVWFLMVVDIETEGEGEGEEGAALYDIDGSSSDDEEMEVWACDLARSDEEELEMEEAAVDSGSQSELSDDEQVEPSTNIKTEMEGTAVDAGSLGKSYEQLEPSTNIKTEMEGAAVDDGSLGKSDEQSEPCTDIKMEMEGAAVDAGSLSKSDEPLEPNTNIKTEMRTKMEGAAVDAEGLKKGNKRKCM